MANKDIVQETFPVLGMSCASCSARVEKTLNHQPGVRKAVVNYASAMATVEYDLQNCSPETLQQAVQAAGYDLLIKQDENMPDEVEQAHDKKYRALKFRTTWAIALSVPVMLIGMFFMDMPMPIPSCGRCPLPSYSGWGGDSSPAPGTIAAWQRQYGHTGSHQYGDRLSVQPVQHAISGLLAIQRHPSACIF